MFVKYLNYLATHTNLSPIRHEFTPGFVNYKNGCTRHTAANDKICQLLAHGRWFSPASSTTKTKIKTRPFNSYDQQKSFTW
jgi:hypothetical protein